MIEILFSKREDVDVFMKKNNIKDVAYAENVHGSSVAVVDYDSVGKTIKGKDALVTTEEELYLCTRVADCLPVFFWDEDRGVVALAHAGWKGLNLGIIPNVIKKMKQLSCYKISAYIGPGIGKCHFEVKNSVASNFLGFTEERDGKVFVDLKAFTEKQLYQQGVFSIKVSKECTYCDKRFFSYRRDGGEERMSAFIKRSIKR